ncbi:hypothetical protein [Photobacterium leiognathi]|uniref:hypothetical protein n=1 Tax=Photobacterium leiognathi TaxID=553611 RepID=UPI002734751E|nr:hypothetical protein [Photobacterium leiognathi]
MKITSKSTLNSKLLILFKFFSLFYNNELKQKDFPKHIAISSFPSGVKAALALLEAQDEKTQIALLEKQKEL